MLQEITGGDHKIVKQIAALKEKKYRERYGAFLVEGTMSVLWALQSSFEIKSVVISADFQPPAPLAKQLDALPVYRVPDRLFAKMADTKTPQGILCVCALPPAPPLPKNGLYIYCDRVRDPGNVGSIIRSADAMGFDGVMLSPESVDPYNPKLVRSTMGSLFHVRLYTGVTQDMLRTLQRRGFTLAVSALAENCLSLTDWQIAADTIIAVGNEAGGVSAETLAAADTVVKIPMAGSAESLNVAAAAAILMYEAAKDGGRI